MKRTIAASPGFILEKEGSVLFLNGNKYAVMAQISQGGDIVEKAVYMLHSPRKFDRYNGFGYLLPVEFFKWWFKYKMTEFQLIGQNKKTGTHYKLRLGKLKGILPIKLKGRDYYFFGLQFFDCVRAAYVKPPRKPRKRRKHG